MNHTISVGLVLSGGGAKGAYQVGIVKALAKLETDVKAVAGASIGALNGAILASAPSLQEGAVRLEELWMTLAQSSPLAPNIPAYFSFLQAASLRINGLDFLLRINRYAQQSGLKIPIFFQALEEGLLSSNPLNRLMDQYLNAESLAKGLPMYVSVFESKGAVLDVVRFVAAEIGLFDSPLSDFIHIQDLPSNQQRDVLLASAALPILFEGRELNGTVYRDGGLGGAQRMQGNTPITPLLQAGIKTIIVTHLSDGSLWSRHDFPEATILEIRPQSFIKRDGGIKDLLGFDQHKIPSWIEQGYNDTLRCVQRVKDALASRHALNVSQSILEHSEEQFARLDVDLDNAMARLR